MTSEELLIFEIGSVNFSVRLSVVEEVVPATVITSIPNSPGFLLGVAAVRGKVMAVIDAARRYGMPAGLGSYFMVCQVRGNLTAIVIERPVVAGLVPVRRLGDAELDEQRVKNRVDSKFIKTGFELLESAGEGMEAQPTGTTCFEVDPDLFVSAEMASKVGEAS